MNYGRLFVGVILVTLGALLALDAADVLNAGDVIAAWWPLIFIVAAVIMYVSNPTRWMPPVVIFVIAGVILLESTGLVEANLWQFVWPALLIIVGLSFLFRQSSGRGQATRDDRIEHFAIFSGIEVANHSQHFTGGSVSAIFGGAEVDLRNAQLDPGASLDVFTAFGGVEIAVPQGWKVVLHGFPLFGGFDNITTKESLSTDAPNLDVHAVALFGGIEVKH
jgi:predicted membrane protein